jgi:hypothetical protein
MEYTTFLKQFKQLIEQTTRYTPPNLRGDRGDYMDNYDKYVDFPYVEDPEQFITHRPLEQDAPPGPPSLEDQDDEIKEQSAKGRTTGSPKGMETKLTSEQAAKKEPAIDPEAAGAAAGAGAGEEMGAEAGAAAGEEVGADLGMGGAEMGVGGIPGMPGMEPEEKLTSSQIGRVYELKKIYSRLSSIESYLSRATDQSILELRKYVAESIDLFEIVISNYDQYKENVDDIIVQFYEFLDVIYSSIRKYYKGMKN